MVIVNSNENGKNHGSTYFPNGIYMDIRNDLKRIDESVVPTSRIIGWSVSSRNEIININNKKRFAHKWKKLPIQKLNIRSNM